MVIEGIFRSLAGYISGMKGKKKTMTKITIKVPTIEEFENKYYKIAEGLSLIAYRGSSDSYSISNWIDSLADYEYVFGKELKIRRVEFYPDIYYPPIKFDLEDCGKLSVQYCSSTGEHETLPLRVDEEATRQLIEAVLTKLPKIKKGNLRSLNDYIVVDEE